MVILNIIRILTVSHLLCVSFVFLCLDLETSPCAATPAVLRLSLQSLPTIMNPSFLELNYFQFEIINAQFYEVFVQKKWQKVKVYFQVETNIFP